MKLLGDVKVYTYIRYPLLPFTAGWSIPKSDIKFGPQIGKGEFGGTYVYLCLCISFRCDRTLIH